MPLNLSAPPALSDGTHTHGRPPSSILVNLRMFSLAHLSDVHLAPLPRVSPAEQGEIVLSISHRGITDTEVRLHFSVLDTGIGIPAEKQEQIFEAFGQADRSTTRRFGGTGLGLNISRQLIEMMGGRLGLESEEGRGTEFMFELDFVHDTRRGKPRLSPPAVLRGLPILVVDDNATNRFILTEVLTCWHMEVTCRESAAAGFQAMVDATANGQPYQLVLLDMMMPETDGLMLAEQIQSDRRFKGTPLIMLSSAAGRDVDDRGPALGIVGQLRKPIKQTDLLEQILQGLGVGEREPPALTDRLPSRAARSVRILLAEDGVVNRKVAVGLLEAREYDVTVAANGRLAVDAAAATAFDLILMDIEMPEMDGLEATAAIRDMERDTDRHIPIVAMTAHAIKGDQERFLRAGMDAHIAKPVEPQLLYQLIDEWTRAPELQGGLTNRQ